MFEHVLIQDGNLIIRSSQFRFNGTYLIDLVGTNSGEKSATITLNISLVKPAATYIPEFDFEPAFEPDFEIDFETVVVVDDFTTESDEGVNNDGTVEDDPESESELPADDDADITVTLDEDEEFFEDDDFLEPPPLPPRDDFGKCRPNFKGSPYCV